MPPESSTPRPGLAMEGRQGEDEAWGPRVLQEAGLRGRAGSPEGGGHTPWPGHSAPGTGSAGSGLSAPGPEGDASPGPSHCPGSGLGERAGRWAKAASGLCGTAPS